MKKFDKVDKTVIFETKYISFFVVVLSILTQSIFLIANRWDYTVLLGNLISGFVAILNFFLMGLTIQKALDKEDKNARSFVQLSQSLRIFMQFAVAAVGVLLPCFNTITSLIPLFFPRIAVSFRGLFMKKIEKRDQLNHSDNKQNK